MASGEAPTPSIDDTGAELLNKQYDLIVAAIYYAGDIPKTSALLTYMQGSAKVDNDPNRGYRPAFTRKCRP